MFEVLQFGSLVSYWRLPVGTIRQYSVAIIKCITLSLIPTPCYILKFF